MLGHCEFFPLDVFLWIIELSVDADAGVIIEADHLTCLHEVAMPLSSEDVALGKKELT